MYNPNMKAISFKTKVNVWCWGQILDKFSLCYNLSQIIIIIMFSNGGFDKYLDCSLEYMLYLSLASQHFKVFPH